MTDTTSPPRLKITYATLNNDNDEMHAQFEAGLERARGMLGDYYPNFVNGADRDGDGTFEKRTPIDGTLMGTFARGTREDAREAIAAAKAAFPGWSRTPWQERVTLLRRVADLISERQMEFSALLSMEVGKNRLESLGDVEETADLIRWSCDMMERNDGFDHPMGNLGDTSVHTRSVLKPYGVWAVISPFNFPFALSGGPAGGALVAGNTVVFKPSTDAPLSGACLTRVMRDAGIPEGVFNMVAGPGESVGAELQENEDIDGLIFTGSFEVGFGIYRNFPRTFPKPVIVEMGGKNPAIVSRKADLDEAAEGVMRSAFGFSGQKCSANSRVYVERPVLDEFTELLIRRTEGITIGDPTKRENWLGPVINQRAMALYENSVAEARTDGRLLIGGERVTADGLDSGYFVAPTVATDLPTNHRLFRDELFLPFTVIAPVDSLDEALRLANDSVLGLTAGLYSEDQAEIDQFLDGIEAGVVYVNRRAGATTGAWPGIQPFGGWKGSTATSKSGGGYHYVQQFMREQSQTVVD
ncbi:MAG: aldehyde dehydrogenase family protein [Chloroflexi bacterium]|nr:aldehyde dehydrogenase family protein [Chloroflexota bacterium]MBA3795824.1 aldehyde dehydrogenase family protein [Chloroflexota bacterium]